MKQHCFVWFQLKLMHYLVRIQLTPAATSARSATAAETVATPPSVRGGVKPEAWDEDATGRPPFL